MKKKMEKGVIGEAALLQVPIPKLGIKEILELRQGSIAVPPKLLALGK